MSTEDSYIPRVFLIEQFTAWHQNVLDYQFCIRQSCAKRSFDVSRNECCGTEGMRSKTCYWLSKISASRAHTSIQNQTFLQCVTGTVTLHWRSNSQRRVLGWCRLSGLISWEAGSVAKHQLWWMSLWLAIMQTPGNEASPVPNHIHLQGQNEGATKKKGITMKLTSIFI